MGIQTSCSAAVSWGLLSSNASLDCCLSFFNREVTKKQNKTNKKSGTDKGKTSLWQRVLTVAVGTGWLCLTNEINSPVPRVAGWDQKMIMAGYYDNPQQTSLCRGSSTF